ncbi:peptidase S41 [Thermaurantimonas aggregans]|uniref:Peptidase S41 n=1 Tax=Thermaurantimonas aggregans TaxID=2173829 RepID=A0A401XJM8_9FLAO|nr:S41 family peptidase [Thermaurantimonas aggregans]MCX8148635.1 S41 family peptidase [Thermaurantimonas aggregans]GCD77212.1 peptidase S41 [Thermaurantimonas aggregans]
MKNYFALLTSIFVLSGCEKVLFEKDRASADPLVNFDYLWNEVDKKYSYFELKNIDWNAVRDTLRPKLSSQSSEFELFEILATMLNALRDDHTNLVAPFNVSRFNIELRSPANYNARTVQQYYVPNGWVTGPFFHDFLAGGQVGYIRYSSFMSSFSGQQLDFVLNRYKDTKGIILDLRSNGGGSVFNVPLLLSRFTNERVLAGYTITRNGPGHSDFSKRESFYITPDGSVRYLKPVMVLIDKGSYSATTFFAVLSLALPNLTLIGDTTGGGGGLPNGGQLPNGWRYRFSVSQLLDLQGNNYAEDGVPPQIPASFDWSDLTRDEIIERALQELL